METLNARVAELADAQDLKSCVLTDVRVQVPPRVLRFFAIEIAFLPKRKAYRADKNPPAIHHVGRFHRN